MYTCSMLPSASLAYLHALGMDVWVRRERLAAAAAAVEPMRKREAATPAAAARPPAADPVGKPADEPAREPPVEFVIRCVRFGRVLALIDESLWQERRFFLDVARAMHGSGRVEREASRFDWPQMKTGDAGMGAAGRAFRAYLETQIVEHTRVLAVGARVRELIGPSCDELIYLDRALRGLTEKKSLWRQIQKLK